MLPFFGFENPDTGDAGRNIYCCRLPPNTDIDTVRQDILMNRRSVSCATCWQLEDQGLTSERMLHNSALDFYWDRDLSRIEQEVRQGQYSTRMVKLSTSNVCNGTCVTCGPDASSAWARLRKQTSRYQSIKMQDLMDQPWQDIKSLGFVGGEPLLEKTNFDLLQHLLDIGNSSCFIHIVTNGSIEINDQQLDVLSKFKNLNLCVSIDGVDQRFEYLRFPLQWRTLLANLRQFRDITHNISVSCMISNLSIFYLDETLDWFQDQDLRYLAKQIESPEYFSPGNLPPKIKDQIMSRTTHAMQCEAFLACGAYSPDLWQQCWQEIQVQDQLKHININDYLPLMAATRNAGNTAKLQEMSVGKTAGGNDQIF